MELVWTNTVPRYLVDRNSGRDVSYMYPGLHYPYVSYEQQRASGTPVLTRGVPVTDPVPLSRETRRKPMPTATVSTRSTPNSTAKPPSHRYVQVGALSTPETARQIGKRLAARGLTARLGKVQRKGNEHAIVLLGPFKTQAQLDRVVSVARGAGAGKVVLRK